MRLRSRGWSPNYRPKENIALKNELLIKEPLVRVGIDVRLGFIENTKYLYVGGQYCVVRGTPNMDIIATKNRASHNGNYEADYALIRLWHAQHSRSET